MNLTLQETINLGENVYPNSLTIYDDKVFVCEAKNKILVAHPNNKIECLFGNEGFGKYSFRQPVFITKLQKYFAIADWHNHRIVFYDLEFKYLCEMGQIGLERYNRLKNTVYATKRVLGNHAYFLNHCGENTKIQINKDTVTKKLVRLVSFWLGRKKLSALAHFNKPNGIAQSGDNIVVTQKNSNKIQLFRIVNDDLSQLSLVKEISLLDGVKLGRLGNCHAIDQYFYVNDETNHCVWVIDMDGSLVRKVVPASNLQPFTCARLRDVLVIGGVKGVIGVSMKDYKILFEDFSVGEVHSISSLSNNQFIVACRDSGQLKKFVLENEVV